MEAGNQCPWPSHLSSQLQCVRFFFKKEITVYFPSYFFFLAGLFLKDHIDLFVCF